MAAESTEQNNDRTFCWEQVVKTNRVFRVSQVFASRHCAARLLPLYALFSTIEQICSTVSEEDITRSKLNWWRFECLQKELTESQHPVLRELTRTDASKDLSKEIIARLLDAAESRLDASAPSDLESLQAMCVELQRPQVELEFNVCGLSGSGPELDKGFLASSGLLQLIRESVYGIGQGGFWWMPLSLIARHGVGREDFVVDPQSPAVAESFADVFAAEELWCREPIDESAGRKVDYSKARHLFSINGLYSRKLKRLAQTTPDLFAAELDRLGPADLFQAWMSARRF